MPFPPLAAWFVIDKPPGFVTFTLRIVTLLCWTVMRPLTFRFSMICPLLDVVIDPLLVRVPPRAMHPDLGLDAVELAVEGLGVPFEIGVCRGV